MRAPSVFSFLSFLRASRLLPTIGVSLFFANHIFAYGNHGGSGNSSVQATYTKVEKAAEDKEKKELQSFVVDLLKDYGCKDFEKKAFEAILEHLRKNSQPKLSFRERHKAMVSQLRVYNESDRPAGSFDPAKKQFSALLLDLNELTSETLFSYYVEDTNGKVVSMEPTEIANILEFEKVTSIETPKKKILDLLDKLNALKDENHLDVGCQNEDNKNFLMLDLPRGYVSLTDLSRPQVTSKIEPQKQEQVQVQAQIKAHVQSSAEKQNQIEKPIDVQVERKEESQLPIKKEEIKEIPKKEIPKKIPPEKEPDYGHTKLNDSKKEKAQVQAQAKEAPKADPVKPKETSYSETRLQKENTGESNSEIVERYLSLTRDEVKPYMKSGWDNDYEEFITAFILNGHTKLLRNFYQFEDVCDDLSRFNTPQNKAQFVAKLFKALAIVETVADPRIETRESTAIRYRPKSNKPYIQHSVGLFQLDENDSIYHNCEEIDYKQDVSIGYPSSRVRKTPWSYQGVHVEYYGDTRKSILNPFVNAACAVRILENKIPGGLISDNSYWAPLRPDKAHAAGRSKLKKIIRKEIPGC